MPTISQNVQAIRDEIASQPPDSPLAKRIGEEGIAAILGGGIGSDDWRRYMQNFATDDDQLARLMGDDPDFMAGDWGKQLLGYLVAASPCMSGTGLRLFAELPQELKDIMDSPSV